MRVYPFLTALQPILSDNQPSAVSSQRHLPNKRRAENDGSYSTGRRSSQQSRLDSDNSGVLTRAHSTFEDDTDLGSPTNDGSRIDSFSTDEHDHDSNVQPVPPVAPQVRNHINFASQLYDAELSGVVDMISRDRRERHCRRQLDDLHNEASSSIAASTLSVLSLAASSSSSSTSSLSLGNMNTSDSGTKLGGKRPPSDGPLSTGRRESQSPRFFTDGSRVPCRVLEPSHEPLPIAAPTAPAPYPIAPQVLLVHHLY